MRHLSVLVCLLMVACGALPSENVAEVKQAATVIGHSTIVVGGPPNYNSGWSTAPNVPWPTAVSDFGAGDYDDAAVSYTSGSFAEVRMTLWNLAPGEYQKIIGITRMDLSFHCHTDAQLAELEMYFVSNHRHTPGGPPDQYLAINNCPVWPSQATGHQSFTTRPDGTPIDKADFLVLQAGQGFTFERSAPAGWLRADGVVLDLTMLESQ